MPASKHTDAEKLAIIQEADEAPRGYRGTSGKGVVCKRHGIGLRTLLDWRARAEAGTITATEREIKRARAALDKRLTLHEILDDEKEPSA